MTAEVENSMKAADDEDEDDGGNATPSVSSKAATARTARTGRCHAGKLKGVSSWLMR